MLLVEGDLRRPSLTHIFGLGHIEGVCEWLQGVNNPHTACNVYRLKELNLWILPAGKCPTTPLELLQSDKLPQLIDQLSETFDWIIVDSPPMLPLADTSVWTRMIDGILLVTRRGTTEKKQLAAATHALEHEKLLGAILNCSKSSIYQRYYYEPSSAA